MSKEENNDVYEKNGFTNRDFNPFKGRKKILPQSTSSHDMKILIKKRHTIEQITESTGKYVPDINPLI